jgi:hypothetical protein
MRWGGFEAACPEIAGLARARFTQDQLVMLGTIRPDGAPRVSPTEVDLAEGHLFLGMMWRSLKALDLLRDPRIAVCSVPSDKANRGGDVKLSGAVVDVHDPELRAAYRRAIQARIDWAPDEPDFHLFSVDVDRASFISFGEGNERCLAWDLEHGLRNVPHPG